MRAFRKHFELLLWLPCILLGLPLLVVALWLLGMICLFAGQGFATWGHQAFAANGVSQIEPARQMEESFEDCRHYITYGDGPLFNSVAYFGGRYVLTMQAPVRIRSRYSGTMAGEPAFYLSEVREGSISSSGESGASFSRSIQFGMAEWEQVYRNKLDFAVIGFELNNSPVANFRRYADACRQSN